MVVGCPFYGPLAGKKSVAWNIAEHFLSPFHRRRTAVKLDRDRPRESVATQDQEVIAMFPEFQVTRYVCHKPYH